MPEKKTYGQLVNEHWSQKHEHEDDVIEYRRMMEPEILKNIYGTIEQAKDKDLYKNHDFYVVLLMKTERMGGVPRTLVLARRSCPTPTYQQFVWKYYHVSGALEFLWGIPDQILYWHVYHNLSKYLKDKETHALANDVYLMESGKLEEFVIKENGEKPDGLIVYKNREIING
jgi:hypothetical protein